MIVHSYISLPEGIQNVEISPVLKKKHNDDGHGWIFETPPVGSHGSGSKPSQYHIWRHLEGWTSFLAAVSVKPLRSVYPIVSGVEVIWLVVSNMIFFCIIYGLIWDNPSHWLSYFSRWLKPPTSCLEPINLIHRRRQELPGWSPPKPRERPAITDGSMARCNVGETWGRGRGSLLATKMVG